MIALSISGSPTTLSSRRRMLRASISRIWAEAHAPASTSSGWGSCASGSRAIIRDAGEKTHRSGSARWQGGSSRSGNLGGGARSSVNLVRLGKLCEWFQGDNQGRGGEDSPIWLCTLQGRVCQAIQDGKAATNVTGAWSTGPIRWRNVGKSSHEAEMWLSETSASGMIPYWHLIGGEKGMGEDRRTLETPKKYFAWTAKHDPHFVNKRTVANVGVVIGQSTHLFYKTQPDATMQQFLNGMYYALLEGRFMFDFVHEDRMELERLSKYSALILPNVAMLSDAQCEQLRAYVKAGGSLLATFETSLYDENNKIRENFGLADIFDIKKTGEVIPTNGNAYYARIERKHEIVEGFADTNWLPGAEYRVPIAPVDNPVLTVVPGVAVVS